MDVPNQGGPTYGDLGLAVFLVKDAAILLLLSGSDPGAREAGPRGASRVVGRTWAEGSLAVEG